MQLQSVSFQVLHSKCLIPSVSHSKCLSFQVSLISVLFQVSLISVLFQVSHSKCLSLVSYSKCLIPSATFQVLHALGMSHSIHLTNYIGALINKKRQSGVVHAGTYTLYTSWVALELPIIGPCTHRNAISSRLSPLLQLSDNYVYNEIDGMILSIKTTL